jgi:N-acetyl-anhydromuramoyl-L-alanine amidase
MKNNVYYLILVMILSMSFYTGCGVKDMPVNGEVEDRTLLQEDIEDKSNREDASQIDEPIIEDKSKIASTQPELKVVDEPIDKNKKSSSTEPVIPRKNPELLTLRESKFNWKTSLDIIELLLPPQNSESRIEPLTHVMIHFISNAFNKPQNPYDIKDIYSIFEQLEVSAHYVIGRDGEVYLLVKEEQVAYHAGRGNLPQFPEYENRLNHYSIGIELLAIGTREEMIPIITAEKFELINPDMIGYTDAQYQSLNVLLDDILKRHPYIPRDRNHIIGHDEYAPGRKTDPGSLFDWSKIGF